MKQRQNREGMEALLAMRRSEGLTNRELAEPSDQGDVIVGVLPASVCPDGFL